MVIPKIWLKLLRVQGDCKENVSETVKKIKTSKSKWVYDRVRSQLPRVDDRFRYKWELQLDREMQDNEWNNNTKYTTQLMLSTKLRSLQYHLVNFALVTNIHLRKWKIKTTDLCSFCNDCKESYPHLFVKCNIVQTKIWKPLKSSLCWIAIVT